MLLTERVSSTAAEDGQSWLFWGGAPLHLVSGRKRQCELQDQMTKRSGTI